MICSVLTLPTLDNLFNLLLFLVGILFTISVTGHHHISLILCLPSRAVIAHPRQSLSIPGCPPQFGRHVPGRLSKYLPSVSPPAVLAYTLPSSDTLYSLAQSWPFSHLLCRPPKQLLSHVSHYTKKGLACRGRWSPSNMPYTGPRLAVPSRPAPSRPVHLALSPPSPVGPLDGSEHWFYAHEGVINSP